MSEKIITLGELRDRYESGERDFTGIKLLNGDLIRLHGLPAGIVLKKADLSEANMEEMVIQKIDLSYANLRNTHLGETIFSDINLEHSDFRNANFCQTTFRDANLRHANFSDTVIEEVSFRGCDLSYANFKDATEFVLARCKRVIFNETIMPDGSLSSDNPRDRC